MQFQTELYHTMSDHVFLVYDLHILTYCTKWDRGVFQVVHLHCLCYARYGARLSSATFSLDKTC